jgi:hypothetical protein
LRLAFWWFQSLRVTIHRRLERDATDHCTCTTQGKKSLPRINANENEWEDSLPRIHAGERG